jgi:hypothetical protein
MRTACSGRSKATAHQPAARSGDHLRCFVDRPQLKSEADLGCWVGRTPSSAADPLVGLHFGEKIGVLAELSGYGSLSATTAA